MTGFLYHGNGELLDYDPRTGEWRNQLEMAKWSGYRLRHPFYKFLDFNFRGAVSDARQIETYLHSEPRVG